jgi:hypothetical protein
VEKRHQLPLRDSSGFAPDSIRSHRVIGGSVGTFPEPGKVFFQKFRAWPGSPRHFPANNANFRQ